MNLESKIEDRLWQMIQSSYESRNFTGAIIDAIYFLSDLIREKSGLASDGVSLINHAFGGNSPKLKVNKLQSASDKNIQLGIAQILRGVYQAIRNPRSHEKHQDSKSDADTIISFVDYLIKIIDQSKSPFTKHEFLERVFESNFVPNKRYADLMISEIPKKQRLDIFFEVYKLKEQGDYQKLNLFFAALLDKFSQDELKDVYDTISEELKITDNDATIRAILQIFPSNYLKNYHEISRLRLENKLIKSIRNGKYVADSKRFLGGELGAWAAGICDYFLLKDDLIHALLNNLSSPFTVRRDYVLDHFFFSLKGLVDPPSDRIVKIINSGLKSGIKEFHTVLKFVDSYDEEWMKPFKEAYDNFEETGPPPPPLPDKDDDIPF